MVSSLEELRGGAGGDRAGRRPSARGWRGDLDRGPPRGHGRGPGRWRSWPTPIAPEVDFFSIGTNDLIQYTLAADRTNPELAELATPFQPAIIRLIGATCRAAAAHGRPVAVCGEAAADPDAAALFVGLGVGELSVAPRSIAAVHAALDRARSGVAAGRRGRRRARADGCGCPGDRRRAAQRRLDRGSDRGLGQGSDQRPGSGPGRRSQPGFGRRQAGGSASLSSRSLAASVRASRTPRPSAWPIFGRVFGPRQISDDDEDDDEDDEEVDPMARMVLASSAGSERDRDHEPDRRPAWPRTPRPCCRSGRARAPPPSPRRRGASPPCPCATRPRSRRPAGSSSGARRARPARRSSPPRGRRCRCPASDGRP